MEFKFISKTNETTQLVILSVTVVDSFKLPLVPVTVMVYVPSVAPEVVESVSVDLPVPVMEAGLKPAVTSVGKPLADKVTAESNPPETVLVILVVPDLPLRTLTEVGEAVRVKLPTTGAVTFRLTLVELMMVPVLASVPVMVIVYVPTTVFEATMKLATDVPLPGEAIWLGAKLTVTPVGWPVAVKLIAELKPFTAVVVMFEVPVLPCTTDTVVGEAEMVKLGAVTVRLTLVELMMVPVLASVPVMVIGYVPVTVFEATMKLATEVPLPGEAIWLGAKLTVTPVGWPEAVKLIAELKPFTAVVVMFDVPVLPRTTVRVLDEAEMVKLGPAEPASAVIRPVPFMLPQPVTRS